MRLAKTFTVRRMKAQIKMIGGQGGMLLICVRRKKVARVELEKKTCQERLAVWVWIPFVTDFG